MNVVSAVFAFLLSGTGRRLLAYLMTVLLTVLNKKLGLELDIPELVALTLAGVGYVLGSNYKEATVSNSRGLEGLEGIVTNALGSLASSMATIPPSSAPLSEEQAANVVAGIRETR